MARNIALNLRSFCSRKLYHWPMKERERERSRPTNQKTAHTKFFFAFAFALSLFLKPRNWPRAASNPGHRCVGLVFWSSPVGSLSCPSRERETRQRQEAIHLHLHHTPKKKTFHSFLCLSLLIQLSLFNSLQCCSAAWRKRNWPDPCR